MTNKGQFEGLDEKPMECAVCEAMCLEYVDGTLTEPERQRIERHVAECGACSKELEEAQRGAAWLSMLKGHTPEPPAALLAKILAGTTGAASAVRDADPVADPVLVPAPVMVPAREPAPAWALSSVLRKVVDTFRIENARSNFQPRLAMTAAMAFVSIALTLNLTGVRLKDLRASDFTPSGMQRTVADARASAARSFQNMRVVYQVESRVSELRGEGPLAQREDANYQLTPQAPNQQQNQQQSQQQQAAPRRKGL